MPSLRPAKIAGLMVLVLLVGSNLVLPAGAHVSSNLSHLQGHLDPRYINANEKAANSNLLDGQDSTAFLGANAKAADADLLDGQEATAFMTGPGKVREQAFSLTPEDNNAGSMLEFAFFEVTYVCPEVLSDNGSLVFLNHSGLTHNLFIDTGSANPTYQQVPGGNSVLTATNATGEFVKLQVHSPNQGIATIHVMSVHRASDCHVQIQAVISN
jgi:hypothetical protein